MSDQASTLAKVDAFSADVAVISVVTPPSGPFPKPIIYPIANRSRLLVLEQQLPTGARYDRANRQKTFTASTFTLRFRVVDDPGVAYTFASPVYKLLVNGVERGRYTRIGAEKFADVGVTLGSEPDGDAKFTILGCTAVGAPDLASVESNVPFVMTINRTGNAKNSPTVSAQRSTEDWTRTASHAIAELPKSWYASKAEPYVGQVAVPFTTRINGDQLFRYLLGPSADANCLTPHHLCTSLDGTQHTNCLQGYFEDDMYMAFMRLPNLDGPRNVCTHYFNLFVFPGRNGKWYAHNPVGWTVTDGAGRRTTLFGKRHKYAPDWLQAKHNGLEEEFVGVCNDPRVPAGEAYPRGSWGGDWDYDSLPLDPTAPPIGGDQPHVKDPTWFATDERGWLWKLVRSGTDPNRGNDPSLWLPTQASLLITGLNVPRFVRHRKGTRELLIGESGGNRIARWNMDTGAFIAPVVENLNGNAFGGYPALDAGRPRKWTGIGVGADPRNAATQAEVILGPEGGDYYRDADGEWVVWGSRAQMDIRRRNLATNVQQKIGNLSWAPSAAPGSQVAQVWVNDNTLDAEGKMPRGGFGPHGSVFGMTFYNKEYGRPQIFTPNADRVTFSEWGNWHVYDYETIAGRGPKWSNSEYPTSGGCGYGQLAECTSLNGFAVTRQATAADPPTDVEANKRGHAYWKKMGYDVLGLYGFTPNGQRPWGENVDCDKWLVQHGHVKP